MQSILVIVDMQNDFVDGALGSPEAVAILEKIKAKRDGFAGKVYYTRDTHGEDYLATREGKYLPVPHCIKGSEGWQIVPSLTPRAGDRVVDKPTFGSTELVELLLADNGSDPIESVTLVGVCTDICVISNAMLIKAALPEIDVVVDGSCCAGVSPESHDRALASMKTCQIIVE